MNEERLNAGLRAQIEAETPDMLSELMEDINTLEARGAHRAGRAEHARRSRRRGGKVRKFLIRTAAAAAALAIAFGAGHFTAVHRNLPGGAGVKATVSLDVNPSVELKIGDDKRVVSCEGLNSEGKEILKKMDLTGADVTAASYAVVGAMVTRGYLSDAANSVLVSVQADEKELGQEIEKGLSEDLNTYLESSSIGAAIVGQYVQADDDVRQFADKNGISDGKAWMIRQLVAGDKRLKEKSLLKLSTQELLVLWTNRKTDASADSKEDGQILFGKVSTKKYVSKQQALAAALNHVGIKRTQASDVEVEYECEDGVIVYEVNFTYGGREYEIDIQAETGTVLGGGPGESSEFTGTPAADGAAAGDTVSGQNFTGQDDDDGPDEGSDDLYDNEADDADDDADDSDDD